MTEAIRVLIADDHPVVRRGLVALLATEPDLLVVGEAASGEEAVTLARRLRPDVVLMDLAMPGGGGIEAIRRIADAEPCAATRVLVLTSFAGDDEIFPAIEAGARGYLLKDVGADDLVRAIHEVHRGEASLSPSVARTVLAQVSVRSPARPPTPDPLSPREVDVLRLVARGLANREIADTLSLSEPTVRGHVSSILGKLHLASRTQAALYALREGFASLDEDGGPRRP